MRVNPVLAIGLTFALASAMARLQVVPCSQGDECCCPDEAECPCAHGRSDAAPPLVETTRPPCPDQALAQFPPAVSNVSPAPPEAAASHVAPAAAGPDTLLLLLVTFRC
jgi:hypothetical protein